MKVRLIADDLTGALDAAAPFSAPAAPVRLELCLSVPLTGCDALTFSTESRDMPEALAEERVRLATRQMQPAPGALWFKKVDSVLRGHPIAETLAMMRAGGFQRCVFAPAFPAMGRITEGGRHLIRDGAGRWQESAVGDLHHAFARRAPGTEVHIPDATSQAGLQAAIAPFRGDPAILWAGSRGLAEALAAEGPPRSDAPGSDTPGFNQPLSGIRVGLFILGTAHPATRAQAHALAGRTRPAPDGPFAPDARAPILLDPVPDAPDAAATHARLYAALQRLGQGPDDSAVFVTGGDCLSLVLERTGTGHLDCLGEAGPGIPVSRFVGGRLDGRLLISKSGGFGGPDLLQGFLPV